MGDQSVLSISRSTTQKRFSLHNAGLRTRLTLLILLITAPLLIISNYVLSFVTEGRLKRLTEEQMQHAVEITAAFDR